MAADKCCPVMCGLLMVWLLREGWTRLGAKGDRKEGHSDTDDDLFRDQGVKGRLNSPDTDGIFISLEQ